MSRRFSTGTKAFIGGSVLACVTGCARITDVDATSQQFHAVVSGALAASISGSANVISSGDRAVAIDVTNGGQALTSIGLLGELGVHAISLTHQGSVLPIGTSALHGSFPSGEPAAYFQGAYVVKQADGDMHFLADSGSVTIEAVGTVVKGSFTMYGSRYELWERTSAPVIGSSPHIITSGSEALVISGTFTAGKL